MTLAEFLRENDLTQQSFADRVGITQGRVAQLLAGDMPSMDLASRIKDATGGAVTPNDFLSSRIQAAS